MSDSEDGFEIDLGDAASKEEKNEATQLKQSPKAKETPGTQNPAAATQKDTKAEEEKQGFDEFEIEKDVGDKHEASISKGMASMKINQTQEACSALPIPQQECQNTYFLMNHLSLMFNENGSITPLTNSAEIYSNSAACPLYGEESKGYNFLITGGYFAQVEEQDDGKFLESIISIGVVISH